MEGKPTETATTSATGVDKPEVAAEVAPVAGTLAVDVPPAEAAAPPAASETPPAATEDDPLLRDIIAALKTVYDPEIPADVYELGLIYAVDVDDDRNVAVTMTLTAPGCPVAGEMPKWVENAVNAVPGVANTTVTMTFDPPWDMGRMSDEARLALNMF
jgi:FeS assembly SUF system protein